MAAFLLSVHVLAAIVFVGSVTVAVSLFPRYSRMAMAEQPVAAARPVVHLLHRISRVYAVAALAVPVFGIGVATALGVLTDAWVLVSMALTLAAGVLLAGVILPRQRLVAMVVDRVADPVSEPAGAEQTSVGAASAADVGRRARRAPASSGSRQDRAEAELSGLGSADRTAAVLLRDASARVRVTKELAMASGVFNLLWAAVVVLMIVRPGSTTGV